MDHKVIHYPKDNKFEIEVDGFTAQVKYVLYHDYLDIVHTFVPPEIGGKGIAASLVETAYTYALENGMRPQATCSYAVMWLKRHPEYLRK